ncbi:MAG: Uma2 family endonuclease [Chloroflexi bacterium]|nr:Uma2 family endonuclease [Chloroflexota bacterium]
MIEKYDNEPQPDLFLWIDVAGKGQASVDDEDYLVGAPDLVIEVAASSASYDLHDKLEMYRHNGVREYGVWRTYEKAFDWFRLDGDDFQPIASDERGVIASATFPGLWLNVQALLAGDLAAVMADLQTGLQSEEHRQFVEWLASDDNKPSE